MIFFEKDVDKLKNQSGIYQVINLANGKIYIGSAKNFRIRFADHLRKLRGGNHPNRYLQNVFNQNPNCLRFTIVELVKLDKLIAIEQKYLDVVFDNQTNCYNMCPTAGSALGRKHSEETKQKIANGNRGKVRTLEMRLVQSYLGKIKATNSKNPYFKSGKDNPMYGKSGSKHHNFGMKHTPESIEKMRLAKIDYHPVVPKKVMQLDLDGNLIRIFESTKLVKLKLGIIGISAVISGKRQTAGGFKWKYVL